MMSDSEVFEFVREVLLSFLDTDASSITRETRIGDLGMESLDFIDLQVEVEKAYGVKIQPAVFAEGHVRTMADFVGYIQRLLGAKSGPAGDAVAARDTPGEV